jgi:hypothetical protein
MFSCQSNGNGDFENLFSVLTPRRTQYLNSRCIVCHRGIDMGGGSWRCSRDNTNDCFHIKIARDHLQKLITGDPAAMDTGGQSEVTTPPGIA